MITLHLLGGARLEGETGPVHGEPAQRHRLALLAVLALASDGRVPRERLLGVLWPEHPPRGARRLLNTSVYVLRRAFGKQVIRTEGRDLRLDFGTVRCDVALFEEALARGDAGRAVELYGGPFMDGVFLDEARSFEEWQEARRAELEGRYLSALETVADEAEAGGDLGVAEEALRSILRHRPTDASLVVHLMRVLEARGDRAEALAAAEAHGAALADTFGAEPDPEVEGLAVRIREAPEPRGSRGGRPRPLAPRRADMPVDPAVAQGVGSSSDHREPRGPAYRRAPWRAVAAIGVLLGLPFAARVMDADDPPPVDPASVAILPFEDLSRGAGQAYLSDGLTEEILDALSEAPGLRVVGRASAFRFRGPGLDIREVGRRLQVAAIVEGSVRVDGERLRVTTRLVDARGGHQIWSARYDRTLDDVLGVQEEIARAVATELTAELAAGLPDSVSSTTTRSPAAYRLYLRGRHEWRKRTEAGMWAALEAFRRAIELDPAFAGAYAGLADTWQLLPDYGDLESGVGLARAKTAALRAVALDSTLAEAHVSLAALHDDYDHDRAAAETAYRRAIELNPGYATARHWLALHLANGGRFPEALIEIERARRLDPLSEIVNTAAGAVRYFARDWDGATAEYRSVLDLRPDFALGHALLGRVQLVTGEVDAAVSSLRRAVELSDDDPSYRAVYAAALAEAGHTEDARDIADAVRDVPEGGYVPYCELASAYINLGDVEQALRLFERARIRRDPALKHLAVEPLYDPIREHPDFVELTRGLGLEGAGEAR